MLEMDALSRSGQCRFFRSSVFPQTPNNPLIGTSERELQQIYSSSWITIVNRCYGLKRTPYDRYTLTLDSAPSDHGDCLPILPY